jgi:hypothetical protein
MQVVIDSGAVTSTNTALALVGGASTFGSGVSSTNITNLAPSYTLDTLTADLKRGAAEVITGVTNGTTVMKLEPAGQYVVFQHKDASVLGTTGAYAGTIGTVLGITSTGILGGYNRTSDGAWQTTFAIESATGNLTLLGTIRAASVINVGAFLGSQTVSSVLTDVSTASSNASTAIANATTALANANTAIADALAAQIDADAAIAALPAKLEATSSYILTGAVGIQNTGGISVGTLTWNSTTGVITGGSGIAITEYGLVGAQAGVAKFYIDSAGNAVFAGSLSAATGTFAGNLSAAGGTFTGTLSAANGTFTGSLSSVGGTFTGALSAASGTFTGSLTSVGGTFTGSLVAATGTFAGSLSAATGTFSGSLSAATGTFSGSLSAASGTFNGDLITTGKLSLTGSGNIIAGYTVSQYIYSSASYACIYAANTANAPVGTFYTGNNRVLYLQNTSSFSGYSTVYGDNLGNGPGVQASSLTGTSLVATSSAGTAFACQGAMTISSSTLVTNLNANYLQGNLASAFVTSTAGDAYAANRLNGSAGTNVLRFVQGTVTGTATANFIGTNKPASTSSNVWIQITIDGTTLYLPAWT